MKINVQSININYIQYGSGEDIVLLHGWGQNIAMMRPLGDKLTNHRITILDLPGFGESDEPNRELTIYDYSDILKEIIEKLKIKDPIIMGHSFGGRVAIVYSSFNKVKKLVLFASPCTKKITKVSFKVKVLKSLKKVPIIRNFEEFAKKHIGSRDYKNASSMMRKILVNTVNEDLSECCKKINCPTLLVWGEQDLEVDLREAKLIEGLIKDSGLVVLAGTHYAYLEQLDYVVKILKEFM